MNEFSQVSRHTFRKYQSLFKQISVQDLLNAAECDRKGLPVRDPKIKKENKQRLRSRIFGMTAMKGPPSLWITVNFADTKDPLVQVFAGADVDMDDLGKSSELQAEDMSKNATENPVAATKAFFFMMKLFFEVLLGIKVNSLGHLKREMGIFGITESYIGSIEAQGRGTLHVHLLVWLHGSTTAEEMQALLKDEDFRRRMELFITKNIRSHVDGLDEDYLKSETSKQRKVLKKIATPFSRPLDPRMPNYEESKKEFEFASARVHHVHKCTPGTCLVAKKKGKMRCKRRAPWKMSTCTRVHENGEWESKRILKWLNTWNPTMMQAFRCNHDIKLLTNAGATKDMAWYMTKYALKPMALTHNMSALLATNFAVNQESMKNTPSFRTANTKMLSQCVNTLGRYQELSSHQIAAHLMGFGDRFESHTFVPIHLRSLMWSCKQQFPELKEYVYNTHDVYIETVYEVCLEFDPDFQFRYHIAQ